MQFIRCIALSLMALLLTASLYSMEKKDSLLQALKTAGEDTNKVNIYLDLARQTFSRETKTAIGYCDKAIALSQKLNFCNGEATANNIKGVCNYTLNLLDSAEANYQRALFLADRCNINKIKIRASGNLGLVYTYTGEYDKAIELLTRSLKMNEALNDSLSIAMNCADIAAAFSYMGKFQQAVSYNMRALEIFRKLGNRQGEANALNTIGSLYNDQKNYREALTYLKMSAGIKEEIGDRKGLTNTYHNMATALDELNKKDSALLILKKSVAINQEIENELGLCNDYISIGLILFDKGNAGQAIDYYHMAYQISYDNHFTLQQKVAAMNLARACETAGDYKSALFYHRRYKEISDSLKNADIEKKVSEVESLYQNEKKQKRIELLEKDKLIQNSELRSQRMQKYAFILGFSLMILIAFITFISYRKIRTQKRIIEDKNEELNQQNEEIRSQRDEIEAQRDEIAQQRDTVTLQRDHIEEQKREITDSITYAKRIQTAVLPDLNVILGSDTGEYFVLFRPRDIVSGDFYWATQVNEWIVFAVADCTGHGVPGAFMSMLGVSFLNEIVRKKEVTKASDVLNQLRQYVVEALQQRAFDRNRVADFTFSDVKDGMDIAVCVYNRNTRMLQFAGANNPLYIVSVGWPLVSGEVYQQQETSNQQLIELKGDKMPVGIYIRMNPFTNHEIQLHPGDTIYLASDGFEDQFGGPENRKMKSKKLKEILLSGSHLPMSTQKDLLETAFTDWKGPGEQLDDVTVLGVRFFIEEY